MTAGCNLIMMMLVYQELGLLDLCRQNCPGTTLQDNGSGPTEDDSQGCLDTLPHLNPEVCL